LVPLPELAAGRSARSLWKAVGMWKAVLLCACVLAQCTDAHRVVGTAPQRSLVTPRRPGPVLMSDEGEGGRKPLNFFQKLAQGLDDLVDDVRALQACSPLRV